MQNRSRNKSRTSRLVPATLIGGAPTFILVDELPRKEWKEHSGYAPVAKEEVHSLSSQAIKGTKNTAIRTDTGKTLVVTNGEAEVFAFDLLTELGYKIEAPRA